MAGTNVYLPDKSSEPTPPSSRRSAC